MATVPAEPVSHLAGSSKIVLWGAELIITLSLAPSRSNCVGGPVCGARHHLAFAEVSHLDASLALHLAHAELISLEVPVAEPEVVCEAEPGADLRKEPLALPLVEATPSKRFVDGCKHVLRVAKFQKHERLVPCSGDIRYTPDSVAVYDVISLAQLPACFFTDCFSCLRHFPCDLKLQAV
jgi:hypothetical protein